MKSGDDLKPLFKLVSHVMDWQGPVPFRALRDHRPDLLLLAQRLGWLVPSGQVEQITCIDCDEPHRERLRWDSEIGYWHKCLNNRRVRLAEVDTRQFTYKHFEFVASLARAIGLDPRLTSKHARENLTCLGYVSPQDEGSKGFVIGLACSLNVPDNLACIIQALELNYKKGPGLLLALEPPAEDMRGFKGHLFADIASFFYYADQSLHFDHDAASHFLFGPTEMKSRIGRPSYNALVHEVVTYLIKKDDWPTKRNAQQDAILDRWELVHGKLKKPSPASLPRILKRVLKNQALR